MVRQPATLQTSWLKVDGPQDGKACAWCRGWLGRMLPQEMRAEFERNHRAPHGCRCTLSPQELGRPDPESPDTVWA